MRVVSLGIFGPLQQSKPLGTGLNRAFCLIAFMIGSAPAGSLTVSLLPLERRSDSSSFVPSRKSELGMVLCGNVLFRAKVRIRNQLRR